ncbi:DNA gyrase subunit B [Streptomyces microflavus]
MTADTSVPSTATLTAAGSSWDSSNYTAPGAFLVLEGLEAVRKRPGMYIGSTDSRGLMHCLWEIIDNSVDEALGGHCDLIEVILHDDSSVEVRDNGRGIPPWTWSPRTGLSGIEVVIDQLHAGGKFGGGSYAASGGLHGVGTSVVNALSARLDVEVDRNSATHSISFRRGVPGMFTEQGPDSPFDPANGLRKGKRVPKARTGTRVRYWADRQIFLKDAKTFDLETLYQRARQTAFLVPGLTIVVRDERGVDGEGKTEETFRFDGGISEFCEYLAQDKAVCDVQRLTGTGTFEETVPVLDDRGHMTATEVTRELGVDIALRSSLRHRRRLHVGRLLPRHLRADRPVRLRRHALLGRLPDHLLVVLLLVAELVRVSSVHPRRRGRRTDGRAPGAHRARHLVRHRLRALPGRPDGRRGLSGGPAARRFERRGPVLDRGRRRRADGRLRVVRRDARHHLGSRSSRPCC